MANRQVLVTALGLSLLGLGVALFWVYLTGAQEFVGVLYAVPSAPSVLLLGLTLSWLCVRFLRWQFLLRRAGVRIPVRASLAVYIASLPGTATPAYVGEFMRCVFIRRRFGTPLGLTAGVLIVERLLDVAALGILAAMTTNSAVVRGTLIVLLIAGCGALLSGGWLSKKTGRQWALALGPFSVRTLVPALAMSLAAWSAASLLVAVAAAGLQTWIAPQTGIWVFSSATLFGGATLMPAGMGTTGSFAILQLQALGVALPKAVVIVSYYRLMSTGVALSLGLIFFALELRRLRVTKPSQAEIHFDHIASQYGDQFSRHVWNHLLDRKIGLMVSSLQAAGTVGVGLDLGCGLGQQCIEMSHRGYRVIGVDTAFGLVRQASRSGVRALVGDGLRLPFADESFDFVYAVGVLHHVPGVSAQLTACQEVDRVLKPGGVFVVHETNPCNPLFRFYMGYVFPILKTIDEGTEWWLDPDGWKRAGGLQLSRLEYFTFIPDFIPLRIMHWCLALERRLEASRLRRYSVHYMAVLRKPRAEMLLPETPVYAAAMTTVAAPTRAA